MSVISLNKLHQVANEFVVQRLIPNAPNSFEKWKLGGMTFLMPRIVDSMLVEYKPTLISYNLINERDQLDIELVKGFLKTAFSYSDKVTIKDFTLDSQEGDILVATMERYKDE